MRRLFTVVNLFVPVDDGIFTNTVSIFAVSPFLNTVIILNMKRGTYSRETRQ